MKLLLVVTSLFLASVHAAPTDIIECSITSETECSKKCGGGELTITKTCEHLDVTRNETYTQEIVETVPCGGTPCIPATVECKVVAETKCSLTCGGGEYQRIKSCKGIAEDGTVISTETVTEILACCDAPCPPTQEECAAFTYTNSVAYLKDAADCNCYYLCQKLASGFLVHHQCCQAALHWYQPWLTCIWPAQTPGGTRCQQQQYAVCPVPVIAPEPTPTVPSSSSTAQPSSRAPTCPYQTNPLNPSEFMYNRVVIGTCQGGMIWDSAWTCACIGRDNTPCEKGVLLYFPFEQDLHDASCSRAVSDLHGKVELRPGEGRRAEGAAAYFDGASYLSVGFLNNWFAGREVSAWTMALWLKRTDQKDAAGPAGLLNNGDCVRDSSLHMALNGDNGVRAGIRTDPATLMDMEITAPVAVGQWEHVAVVYNGNTVQMYLNGNLLTETLNIQGGIENRQCPLTIGRETLDSGAAYFKGFMDEVRIYDRALPMEELVDLYSSA